MGPKEIVEILIETDGRVDARSLVEVSVHLPRRGSRWVASFRDETGRQVWRTTGLRDREPALVLARRWEGEAKGRRAAQGAMPPKPIIRVRPGSGERELGLLTQREVAAIMRISERTVRSIEKRAFDKLRRHPALRDFWREHETGEIAEAALPARRAWALSRVEIAAVNGLAQTPIERQALRKLLALTQGGNQRHLAGSAD
jgi:Sigma-70, region 4